MKNSRTSESSSTRDGAQVLQRALQEEQLDLVPDHVVFGEPDTIALV